MFETPAASASDTRIASSEKKLARLNCGWTSFFRKTVEIPTRITPKGCPSLWIGNLTS